MPKAITLPSTWTHQNKKLTKVDTNVIAYSHIMAKCFCQSLDILKVLHLSKLQTGNCILALPFLYSAIECGSHLEMPCNYPKEQYNPSLICLSVFEETWQVSTLGGDVILGGITVLPDTLLKHSSITFFIILIKNGFLLTKINNS